jgi:hypothetical protein
LRTEFIVDPLIVMIYNNPHPLEEES